MSGHRDDCPRGPTTTPPADNTHPSSPSPSPSSSSLPATIPSPSGNDPAAALKTTSLADHPPSLAGPASSPSNTSLGPSSAPTVATTEPGKSGHPLSVGKRFRGPRSLPAGTMAQAQAQAKAKMATALAATAQLQVMTTNLPSSSSSTSSSASTAPVLNLVPATPVPQSSSSSSGSSSSGSSSSSSSSSSGSSGLPVVTGSSFTNPATATTITTTTITTTTTPAAALELPTTTTALVTASSSNPPTLSKHKGLPVLPFLVTPKEEKTQATIWDLWEPEEVHQQGKASVGSNKSASAKVVTSMGAEAGRKALLALQSVAAEEGSISASGAPRRRPSAQQLAAKFTILAPTLPMSLSVVSAPVSPHKDRESSIIAAAMAPNPGFESISLPTTPTASENRTFCLPDNGFFLAVMSVWTPRVGCPEESTLAQLAKQVLNGEVMRTVEKIEPKMVVLQEEGERV
ncbi:hypothetical protein DFQ27_005031 [Actinomortierella ambigua]|uniref:Uncharacterized protein n=1 Tax=Actinomortierella ambigua TaxID=1343610 RepID=A0A9P6Q1C1_9FUNG|nr:hypothetical protein DFQ27_005031 [Actinomortierella ambigua]